MAINPERAARVLHRDRHCRLRFCDCAGEATEVVMSIGPSFGGGENYGNLRGSCSSCAAEHLNQQRRAARLFEEAG